MITQHKEEIKMKKFIYIFILFLYAVSVQGQTAKLDSLLAAGDKYYEKFDNKKALEIYQKADKLFPGSWQVLWRISRAYIDIGEHLDENMENFEDEQLKMYKMALDYADRAVKLAPNQAMPYVRRAIANGRIALFKGVFSVTSIVDAVRDDCKKAIELGNGGNIVQSLAHYILARTHARVSQKWAPARAVIGLGWADLDTALVEYQKAIDLRPGFIMYYLDYAKALIRNDDYEKAREMLNKALACKKQDEDDHIRLAEVKKLLDEIKDE